MHKGDALRNDFADADDIVLVAPKSRALSMLLDVCQNFATEHYILYSVSKTACMVMSPKGVK